MNTHVNEDLSSSRRVETIPSMGKTFGNRFAVKDSYGETDIFKKTYRFTDVAIAKQFGCYPYYLCMERNEGSVAVIAGKECIMLGSNNYLGLTTHPEVRKAACEALAEYGPSLTGSRLLNGSHLLHEQLEEALAEFFGKESCLVFSTGYQANLGVMSALIGKHDAVVIDKLDHASIRDGAALGSGTVHVFNHNDMKDLDRKLSALPESGGRMVVVDGVFSMEGDLCALPALCEIAGRHKTRVVVDDAHGIGTIGPGGRGTAHHFGLQDKVDLIVGTFSKSLASVGGCVVGSEKVIDFIRHFGRSIIFSASLPPASAAAALKALEILKREPERVERVNANAAYVREALACMGYDVGHSVTPIVPVVIGNELQTLRIWRELLDNGVFVNAVLYPAVPRNQSMLRTSYTSEHTTEHLDQALAVFERLARQLKLSSMAKCA